MSDETTTEMLAEIEPQPEPQAEYIPPKGWRALQPGEALQPGDAWYHPQADLFEADLNLTGVAGSHGYYLRRQVCEGRWKTRGGEIRNVTPTPDKHDLRDGFPWWDASFSNTWRDDGRYTNERLSAFDLVEYLGPIEPEPEPEQTITPDDVAAEALPGDDDSAVVANPFQEIRELRRKLETTEAALLEQQQRNEQLVTQGSQQRMEIAEQQAQVAFLKNRELTLGTRLEEEKAVTTKRLQQVEELRSEVSHVQGLLGESSRRIVELETLVKDLRNINATAEKSAESAARQNADLQHRLDTVAAEWAQQAEATRRLQIELDAREQVPQAVSDRFEEGWDAGTAQAVETIAEWLEPIKAAMDAADNQDELPRAGFFAIDTIRHLPVIMRTLTGLTDED